MSQDPSTFAGLALTSQSSTSLTFVVSFYDGFRVAALPWRHRAGHGVAITMGIGEGYLERRTGGRIVFFWGDLGSSCGADYPRSCNRGIVMRPSADVVRVTIDTRDGDPWDVTVHV